MRRSTLENYDSYPNSIFSQNTLYYKMSNHYRRLYNAKPCVDTSMPKSYKLMKQMGKSSLNKNHSKCINHLHIYGKSVIKNNTMPSGGPRGCKKVCQKNDALDGIESAPYHPRILKTDVQSKLLSSRNYHPPRKKVTIVDCGTNRRDINNVVSFKRSESPNEEEEYNNEYEDDVDWLQLPSQECQEARSSSKPSSSDSAYTEEGEGMWSGGDSRDDSPQQLRFKDWSTSQYNNFNVSDHHYVKFLRTITDEVLRKGIYTNKALKKVFREHIHKNRHKLDMQRMQEEVEKLQNELAIPKDDDLNEMDYGLGCDVDHGKIGRSDYDNLSNIDNSRFCSSSDLLHTAELIESIDQLDISSSVKDDNNGIEEKGFTNVNSADWNNVSNISDNIRLPLKLPVRDNDNDSSIGCEILSGSSDNEIVSSNNIIEDR